MEVIRQSDRPADEPRSFRRRLRIETRASHESLERHPAMRSYAAGERSDPIGKRIVTVLSEFWHRAEPATASLPARYHRLLRAYRAALRRDSGTAAAPEMPFDEIAYFYLLLGSSHGARVMLRSSDEEAAGRRHLKVLSEWAWPLWRPFVSDVLEAISPERHATVLQSANGMFRALHSDIDKRKSSL